MALSIPINAMAHPVAFSTAARSVWQNVGVGFIERVAAFAMDFASVAKVGLSGSRPSFFSAARFASARSAQPRTSLSYAGVLRRVFVAVIAMCAAREMRRYVHPTQDVLAHRYGFEVIRVYAKRIAAKVIERLSIWNAAIGSLPCPVPSARVLAKKSIKAAVATSSGAAPNPARASVGHVHWDGAIFVDLRKQLFGRRERSCHPSFVTYRED